VEDECESNVLTVLVQNKIDLLDEAAYSHEEVEELVHKLNVKLFRTSVKENFNVDPSELLHLYYENCYYRHHSL
jgi:Ras-related protein Rab-23